MSETTRPLLRVDGLSKVFVRGSDRRTPFKGTRHVVEAVRDVSFSLDAGESLGIVGESGSGKTTIARMLMGLERPTTGTMRLDDVDLAEVGSGAAGRRERARLIQMVFQDPYTSLDPRQRIAAGLDEVQRVHFERTRDERNARTEQLLAAVGLTSRHGGAMPRQLSGGQRQRVAIARALATEPRLLVLDEAVSALDVSVQAQILNLLWKLRSELGLTYIMISHDLAVIRQVSERCLVMLRGRVVEQARTEDVLAAPIHPYTERLLRSVPRRGMLLDGARSSGDAVRPEVGCVYSACAHRHDRCSEEPVELALKPGHAVRCWLAEGVAAASAAVERGHAEPSGIA